MAQRAVDLAPANADNLFALSWAHITLGHGEQALAVIEDALWLHPLPPTWVVNMHAMALSAVGRLEEAAQVADRAIAVFAGQWVPRLTRVGALVGLGRIAEAREEAALALQVAPWPTVETSMLRLADSAVELRRRRLQALVAVGFPRESPQAGG